MSEEAHPEKPTFYIPRVEVTETDPDQITCLTACACGGTITYGGGPHTTWTTWGEKVVIGYINAFRCDDCGEVGYTDPVSKALDELIKAARRQLVPQNLGPL